MSQLTFTPITSLRHKVADRLGFLNLRQLWAFVHEMVTTGGLRVSSAINADGNSKVYAHTVIQPDGDIITFLRKSHFEEQQLIVRHFEKVRGSIRSFGDLTYWAKLIGSSPLVTWFVMEGDMVLSLIKSDGIGAWQEWTPTLIRGGVAAVIPYVAPSLFGFLFRWGYSAWRFLKSKLR